MKITRHAFNNNIDTQIAFAQDIIEESIEDLKNNENFSFVVTQKSILELAYIYIYIQQSNYLHSNPIKRSLREYFSLYLDLANTKFRTAINLKNDVINNIIGIEVTLKYEKTPTGTGTGEWLWAFHLAHILRNRPAIDFLLTVPEKLMRQSSLKGDEYHFLYVDFIKSLYLNPKNSADKLMTAYKATDPNVLNIENSEGVLNDTVPQLDLWTAFIMGDHKLFNERLVTALECFKYMVEKDENNNLPQSLVCLPVTAIAAVAYDNGFPIEVESDYIPRMLIEGSF